MNPIRRIRSLLPAALCMLGVLPAQSVPNTTFEPLERVIMWPAGSGNMRALAGCFWDTVDHRSAVGLRGATTHRAVAPGITSYVTTFANETVVDLVTLAGAGIDDPVVGAQRRDAVLMSVIGGAELRLLYVDAAGLEQTMHVPMPGWFRATNWCARRTGNSFAVTATAAGGNTVLRMHIDDLLNFVQLVNVTLTEPVREHCLIDWNNDGILDTAVMTDTAVNIYDPAGGILFSRALAHPGGSIVPVPEPVRRHALALLQRNVGNTGWELVHLDQGVTEVPVPVTNQGADFTFHELLANDGDGDGDHDLAITLAGTQVLLVPNESEDPTTPHFDGSHVTVMTASSLPGTLGQSSFCDYDYDKTADLLLSLLQPNGNVVLVLKTGLSMAFHSPPATYYQDVFMESFHDLGGVLPLELDEDTLTLNLDLSDLLATYEWIKVTYYHGDETYVANGNYLEEEGNTGLLPITSQIEIPVPAGMIAHPELFFVKVQLSSSDNPTTKPTFMGGLTLDNDMLPEEPFELVSPYLDSHRLPGSTDKPLKRSKLGSGRQHIGLVTPLPTLPIK